MYPFRSNVFCGYRYAAFGILFEASAMYLQFPNLCFFSSFSSSLFVVFVVVVIVALSPCLLMGQSIGFILYNDDRTNTP